MDTEITQARQWMGAAAIRALKTAAQTAVATIGTSAAMGQVDWLMVGSTALLAAIVSLLTSLAGIPEVAGGASVAQLREPDAPKVEAAAPAQEPDAPKVEAAAPAQEADAPKVEAAAPAQEQEGKEA